MKNKFKMPLYMITILILLMLIIGIFYLIYININEDKIIKTSGPLSINYENGNKLKIFKKKELNFSIINSSSTSAKYYIEFKNLKNINSNIKYELIGDNGINILDSLNNYDTIVSSYINIDAECTHDYTLKFWSDKNSIYSLELNISEENEQISNFADTILKNNEVKELPITTIGNIATLDEGLIKTNDSFGTAYYFRGNVKNNIVLIDGHIFKIVKINGDGTVRLVYDGVTDITKRYYGDISLIGYNDSRIYDYLNNTWFNTVLRKSKFYIANQKYCNDNNREGNIFLAYNRIVKDNISSLVCLGDKVQAKVGMLTADEVIYAGASLNEENQDFYLYNENIKSSYYLITGAKIENDIYYPFQVNMNGKLVYDIAGNSLNSIRPVITIIKTATVAGSGTYDDPYVFEN